MAGLAAIVSSGVIVTATCIYIYIYMYIYIYIDRVLAWAT